MKASDIEKQRFYSIRTIHGNVPVITVCLLKKTGREEYSRGISICGFSDRLNPKEGKKCAKAMALQALGSKQTGEPVLRGKALDILQTVDVNPKLLNNGTLYKSVYNPILTERESKIIVRR